MHPIIRPSISIYFSFFTTYISKDWIDHMSISQILKLKNSKKILFTIKKSQQIIKKKKKKETAHYTKASLLFLIQSTTKGRYGHSHIGNKYTHNVNLHS